MKKLNNHGWGLSMFITFIAVFLLAIILITVGAIKLGISSHDDTSTLPISEVNPTIDENNNTNKDNNSNEDYSVYYDNYRIQILDAVKNYVSNNNIIVDNNNFKIITVNTLIKENQINKFQINGYTCSGYVIINNNNENYEYNVLVNCGNGLVTEQYDANYDEIVE